MPGQGAALSFFPIPTAGTTEGTANFTIPVDEFAHVHLAVSVSAATRSTASVLVNGGPSTSANSGVVWLDDGETITTSNSAASASTSSLNTQITATSDAQISINGTQIIRTECQVTITSGAGANTTNIDGTAHATYLVSQFDK